jgi:hypothetical protein
LALGVVETFGAAYISVPYKDAFASFVLVIFPSIVRAMGQELLADNYVQADETPVAVQMHDGRGKNHQAYLWQYGRPGGSTIFEFRLSRDREGPQSVFGNFEGILQSDGYAACNLGGWPHTRLSGVLGAMLAGNLSMQ